MHKQRGQLAHLGPRDGFQRAAADDVIGGEAAQPLAGQGHLHVLLNAGELHAHFPGGRGGALQQKPHGGDGRFDLVGPQLVVVVLLAAAAALLLYGGSTPLFQRQGQRLIVGLGQAGGGRKVLLIQRRQRQKGGQLPVAAHKAGKAARTPTHKAGNTQNGGIQQRRGGSGVKPAEHRTQPQCAEEKPQCGGLGAQPCCEQSKNAFLIQVHSTRYPIPFFVRMKSVRPSPSSLRRRRATFTVRVFSST